MLLDAYLGLSLTHRCRDERSIVTFSPIAVWNWRPSTDTSSLREAHIISISYKRMPDKHYTSYTIIPRPVTKSFAVKVLEKSSEVWKIGQKSASASSASSIKFLIRSAAPLIFNTRATLRWRLQSEGEGPFPSLLPSAPFPKCISSPSRRRMNPEPTTPGAEGTLLKMYLTWYGSDK